MKGKEKEKLQSALAHRIGECLQLLGYDLRDSNLKDTPRRMARIWVDELHTDKPATKKLFTVFNEEHDQMITLIGHKTWTRCPHHFERVRLDVSVGYLPAGRVIGLSKLARIADYYALGLVLQERYVEEFAEGLMSSLEPRGVAVYVKGEHLCMQARGVETSGHVVTTALRGMFMDDARTRDEFLRYVLDRKGEK